MQDETYNTDDEPLYMVSAEDENGDHHVFVASDFKRAEERHRTMEASFETVKLRRSRVPAHRYRE